MQELSDLTCQIKRRRGFFAANLDPGNKKATQLSGLII